MKELSLTRLLRKRCQILLFSTVVGFGQICDYLWCVCLHCLFLFSINHWKFCNFQAWAVVQRSLALVRILCQYSCWMETFIFLISERNYPGSMFSAWWSPL